mgnify:CR=1 FL=1
MGSQGFLIAPGGARQHAKDILSRRKNILHIRPKKQMFFFRIREISVQKKKTDEQEAHQSILSQIVLPNNFYIFLSGA